MICVLTLERDRTGRYAVRSDGEIRLGPCATLAELGTEATTELVGDELADVLDLIAEAKDQGDNHAVV